MKDLKSSIEQTCIEFGKFVQKRELDKTTYDMPWNVESLWVLFQKEQAKEVMGILDACENPQEPNDKLKEAAINYKKELDKNKWVRQKLEEGEEEGFDDDLMDKDCKGFDRLEESDISQEPMNGTGATGGWIETVYNPWIRQKLEERKDELEFGSTQDKINHEVLMLVKELQIQNTKQTDTIELLSKISESNQKQIKVLQNIVSANEIALNHLEKDGDDEIGICPCGGFIGHHQFCEHVKSSEPETKQMDIVDAVCITEDFCNPYSPVDECDFEALRTCTNWIRTEYDKRIDEESKISKVMQSVPNIGYDCSKCGGTSPTSYHCENPSCPNMPCYGKSRDNCCKEGWGSDYWIKKRKSEYPRTGGLSPDTGPRN